MTDIQSPRTPVSWPELFMTLFLRLVALCCLFLALRLWASLIGYSNGGLGRFDLLPTDIKAAQATLSVLYPVAAVGLWLKGAWGPVIWVAASALEIAMHEGMPGEFGLDAVQMAAIAVIVLCYLLLRLALILEKASRQKKHG